MSERVQTVFEQTMQDYEAWTGAGESPAYPLYSGDVVALLDKFPKFPGQVVIFPRQGYPDQDVSMYDLPNHSRLSVDLVAHTLGRHMSRIFEGVRIIRHDEGYAVPNHPHAVLLPAARGEGRKLYEPSTFTPTDDYFEQMQALLALTEKQKRFLDSRIARFALEAAIEDWT